MLNGAAPSLRNYHCII